MRQALLTRAGAGPHIVLRDAVPCVSRTDPAPHLPRSLTGLLSPAPVTGVIGEVAGIRLTLMYLYASLCMVRFLARSGMHARRPTLMGCVRVDRSTLRHCLQRSFGSLLCCVPC